MIVFVRRPGGRLLELGDESRRGSLIFCTVHCCGRWIAPLSHMCCVFLLHARERVMHQGQVWLSDGRIRASGAHSPGLRRIRRSGENLEKDGGSDDKIKYEKEGWECCMLNIYQTPKFTLWHPSAKIFHHTLLQEATTLASAADIWAYLHMLLLEWLGFRLNISLVICQEKAQRVHPFASLMWPGASYRSDRWYFVYENQLFTQRADEVVLVILTRTEQRWCVRTLAATVSDLFCHVGAGTSRTSGKRWQLLAVFRSRCVNFWNAWSFLTESHV